MKPCSTKGQGRFPWNRAVEICKIVWNSEISSTTSTNEPCIWPQLPLEQSFVASRGSSQVLESHWNADWSARRMIVLDKMKCRNDVMIQNILQSIREGFTSLRNSSPFLGFAIARYLVKSFLMDSTILSDASVMTSQTAFAVCSTSGVFSR